MLRHKKTKHATPYSRNNSSPLPAEFKFQHPFTMIVAGPTMSGKSTWMKQLLLSDLITPPPNRIIWLYKRWQPLYDELKDRVPHLEFIGAAVAEWLSSWLTEQEDRGSIPGLATWIFRDWFSPASKSRYGCKIAKSTLILKTTNQPIWNLYKDYRII